MSVCVIHVQCICGRSHIDSSGNIEQMTEKGIKGEFWDLPAAEMRETPPAEN